MNIDVELFRLILKYHIYDVDPVLKDIYLYDYFVTRVNEIIAAIPEEKVIAIRGAGVQAKRLLDVLTKENTGRISYVVDRRRVSAIDGYDIPVLLCGECCEHKPDVLLVASFRYGSEFVMDGDWNFLDGRFEVIDIYDVLEMEGAHFTSEFYQYPTREMKHITYMDTSIYYNKFRLEKNLSKKKFFLRKLIAYLLEIKDFMTLFDMVDEYIRQGWDTEGVMKAFQVALENFLDHIAAVTKERKQKDVILNWIDNVRLVEFENTEFGKHCMSDCYYFANAYTNSPWTHLVMSLLFMGQMPISDKTYQNPKYSNKNGLLKLLQDADYQFLYIATPGLYQKYFQDTSCVIRVPKGFEQTVLNDRGASECSTRFQWHAIREIAKKNEKPRFILVHCLAEPHTPFLRSTSPSLKSSDDPKRRKPSLDFLLETLQWYERFDSQTTVRIYLTDHAIGDGRPYSDDKTHVPFAIKGIGVKKENRLYSHKNFIRLVKAIISEEKEDWDAVFEDCIEYENVDYMNKGALINGYILRHMRHSADIFKGLLQCRAIRTTEDLYAHYACGVECYYRLPDEDTNLINEESWQDRIAELREQCGDDFIDISTTPEFRDSHIMYDYLRLLPPEKVKW